MSQSVSIIIPTFNAAEYLPDAIQSCLTQTHQDIEIIVVDDGSTDNTEEIVRRFPVTYIYQRNAGPAAARNRGWLAAKAQYLQFLDADDILLPTKIERCLQAFTPDTDLVYTNYEYCSSNLKERLPTPRTITPEGNVLTTLLNSARSLFPPHAALLRRSAADRTRKFREQLNITEDWYFWIEVAATGAAFRYVDEILVRYRVTPGSLSKDPLKMAQARLIAAEALTQLPLPENFDLNRLVAGRHHVLGLRFWDAGNRREARKQFRQAVQLSPLRPYRHLSRCYLIVMTYFTRRQTAESLLRRALTLARKT